MLPSLFDALKKGNQEEVASIAAKISKLEHEADLTKNEIRSHLKSHLLLPVDPVRLLEVLSIQDGIADKAEDVGVLLTLRRLELPEVLQSPLRQFLRKNIEAFDAVYQVVAEINEIIESSFGGAEATKLHRLVERVAYLEHEVDLEQRSLLKALFNHEELFSHAPFQLWMHVIEELGQISNLSEKLANWVLMTMEVK
jgi:predicted phosphate transport protein (TIGR00153 family)